jgi:hypothetical protein
MNEEKSHKKSPANSGAFFVQAESSARMFQVVFLVARRLIISTAKAKAIEL